MTGLPPLVGLVGKKRAGKDTFAGAMDWRFMRVAFADPLREAAYALNPIVGWNYLADEPVRYQEAIDLGGYEEAKDDYPEVRGILQRLGTESIRALDDGFWLRAGTARIDELRDSSIRRAQGMFDAVDTPVVVTDVRYPNEADAIRERGGVIVRILRPGTTTVDGHPSENALDEYAADRIIVNDGTLAALERHAAALSSELLA